MLSAGDRIGHVQVIGPDAVLDELLHELFHDVGIVVDALEEHSLGAEGAAGVGEACQRLFGRRR